MPSKNESETAAHVGSLQDAKPAEPASGEWVRETTPQKETAHNEKSTSTEGRMPADTPPRRPKMRSKSVTRRSTELDRRGGRFRSLAPTTQAPHPVGPPMGTAIGKPPLLPLPDQRGFVMPPHVWAAAQQSHAMQRSSDLSLLIQENIRLNNELLELRQIARDAAPLERTLKVVIQMAIQYALQGSARRRPYKSTPPAPAKETTTKETSGTDSAAKDGNSQEGVFLSPKGTACACPHCHHDWKMEQDYFINKLKQIRDSRPHSAPFNFLP
eukprot:Blabericola_migrator_1__8032@NODE_411_length_8732_cov_37_171725_g324_i0_p3_GENE_NODE_411_length_8732_cov_37_171725_g324_i0NODE_411_length_8732_cov_37_171725_g324_i0_p3_ORF_typecomplete_len270_score36_31_NODE_411_length_8732_cov_37_171725_g324_i08891698